MITGPGPLLIRADANTQIGTGHVMRCLALAQAWQDAGGQAKFVQASAAPALETRLIAEGIDIARLSASPGSATDSAQTVALAQKMGATWVVVDGYQFDAAYQQAMKRAGLPLLVVDDYGHASHYYADLVLNQNIHADESLYSNREPHTRLLMGARYVLLRREFWPWRGWRREIPAVAHRVLVTLGGGDPDNQTLKVFQALQQVDADDLEAIVVVGASNPHFEELRSEIRNSPLAIRLVHNVANMVELMAWADVAVSAGGSTCWEMAFMGLPTILLVLAENQRGIAEGLSQAGVALNLGSFEQVISAHIVRALSNLIESRHRRQQMSHDGQEMVDGIGSKRVLSALQMHMKSHHSCVER